MRWTRRGARWGFPVRHAEGNLAALLSDGFSVLLIEEFAEQIGRPRMRVPVCRFVPGVEEPSCRPSRHGGNGTEGGQSKCPECARREASVDMPIDCPLTGILGDRLRSVRRNRQRRVWVDTGPSTSRARSAQAGEYRLPLPSDSQPMPVELSGHCAAEIGG